MDVIIYQHPIDGELIKCFYKGEAIARIERFKRRLRKIEAPYLHKFITGSPVAGDFGLQESGVMMERYTPPVRTNKYQERLDNADRL